MSSGHIPMFLGGCGGNLILESCASLVLVDLILKSLNYRRFLPTKVSTYRNTAILTIVRINPYFNEITEIKISKH